jgi:hypothetical protein
MHGGREGTQEIESSGTDLTFKDFTLKTRKRKEIKTTGLKIVRNIGDYKRKDES